METISNDQKDRKKRKSKQLNQIEVLALWSAAYSEAVAASNIDCCTSGDKKTATLHLWMWMHLFHNYHFANLLSTTSFCDWLHTERATLQWLCTNGTMQTNRPLVVLGDSGFGGKRFHPPSSDFGRQTSFLPIKLQWIRQIYSFPPLLSC